MNLVIFMFVVGTINVYSVHYQPDMMRALVAMDLFAFAMALAIIYANIISDEKD